eukprot:595116-Prorocentrum_minimum.AAC.1
MNFTAASEARGLEGVWRGSEGGRSGGGLEGPWRGSGGGHWVQVPAGTYLWTGPWPHPPWCPCSRPPPWSWRAAA